MASARNKLSTHLYKRYAIAKIEIFIVQLRKWVEVKSGQMEESTLARSKTKYGLKLCCHAIKDENLIIHHISAVSQSTI